MLDIQVVRCVMILLQPSVASLDHYQPAGESSSVPLTSGIAQEVMRNNILMLYAKICTGFIDIGENPNGLQSAATKRLD